MADLITVAVAAGVPCFLLGVLVTWWAETVHIGHITDRYEHPERR